MIDTDGFFLSKDELQSAGLGSTEEAGQTGEDSGSRDPQYW